MGRRSINTTKSGKYMNPTDQARKEARRKELKKNKKQRFQVRHAVLKSKDPLQLLQEASFYDKQEFDPSVAAPLSERVIQDKRKKLLETFDRLITLYHKEEPEKAISLQTARDQYDKDRHDLIVYYEQVKLAERVKASEIPLPDLPADANSGISTADIPLPPLLAGVLPLPTLTLVQPNKEPAKSILKKGDSGLPPGPPPGLPPALRKPPGPPPGPPPELSDSESEEDESLAPPGTQLHSRLGASRRIRFADDDSYDPETAIEKDTRIKFRKGRGPAGLQDREDLRDSIEALGRPVPADLMASSTLLQANFSTLPPPPSTNNPLPPGMGLPPGVPPQRMSINIMPRPMGLLPPRLPPGAIPNLLPGQSAVLSAPPSLNPSRPKAGDEGYDGAIPASAIATSATTIQAKPQLKNLIGDATKFVPTAVKVRRTVKDSRGRLITLGGGQTNKESSEMYKRSQGPVVSVQSTGDAYDQFMKEMNELI